MLYRFVKIAEQMGQQNQLHFQVVVNSSKIVKSTETMTRYVYDRTKYSEPRLIKSLQVLISLTPICHENELIIFKHAA